MRMLLVVAGDLVGSVLGLVLHGIGRALRLVLGLVDGLVRRVGRDRNGVAHRVVRLLGAKTLFVTNAAGCVNTDWNVGELMLLSDHIKLFDFGPLRGPNLEEFGTRFPDMTTVYTPRLRALAHEAAKAHNIPLREGVYMYFPGPQFETPAEVRAARVLGADAVGMSTVPETIVAAHCGMEVMGVTLLANMAAGVLPQPLSGAEVNEAAEAAAPVFSEFLLSCLESL